MPCRPFLIALLLALTALAGCAQFTKRPEPPQVTLAGIELLSLGVFEQQFRVRLNLDNPNDYALPVSGVEYALELNGQAFANGRSREEISLPANGRAQVDVDVSANLSALLGQALLLQQGRLPKLDYRLTGKLRLMDGLFSVPFERQGSIPLIQPAPSRAQG